MEVGLTLAEWLCIREVLPVNKVQIPLDDTHNMGEMGMVEGGSMIIQQLRVSVHVSVRHFR